MATRRKKLALWRRPFLAIGNIGLKRRGARRGNFGEVLWVFFLAILALVLTALRLVWRVVYFLIFYDRQEAKRQRELATQRKERRTSLRSTKEWQGYYRDARALFVRVAEKAEGPENLHCACCQIHFPTSGKRGFHIDHILSVSTHPELSFDMENFQFLCEACNIDKSNHQPLVLERRSEKLQLAAARGRREWLKKHGDVDPIHALIEAHEERYGGKSAWSILRGKKHA